jgi:hypothetical protein
MDNICIGINIGMIVMYSKILFRENKEYNQHWQHILTNDWKHELVSLECGHVSCRQCAAKMISGNDLCCRNPIVFIPRRLFF